MMTAELQVEEIEVSRRTAHDGNVVLEGVPEVPDELVAQLTRYQNVRAASFQAWKPDGSGLYIKTRFGEVAQLHRVEMPGGARHQLTFFPEPIRGAVRRPGHKDLGFSMDEGGTENYQLYLFDPARGTHRLLTDGKSRNTAMRFSRDGKRIAYVSTRRNGRSNDLWVMEVDRPSSARMVHEAPAGAWWSVADWSADGKRLLVAQYLSINVSRAHVLDLESGTLELIAGEEPSVNLPSAFDPSGDGIFLVSDLSGEFTHMEHLDLESGKTPDHHR